MLEVATAVAHMGGEMLLKAFGQQIDVRFKTDASNVVTEADLASERVIVQHLERSFPDHIIIGEESGRTAGSSEYAWIIDPLDGTSNFVAGLPWFGVLVALLRAGEPVIGVVHLPVSNETYVAEAGRGAFRNGQRIHVSEAKHLKEVLWGFGLDGTEDPTRAAREARQLLALSRHVRNLRATNSLVDAALTADGRFGGFVNMSSHVWDVAAPCLLVQEAGGIFTNLDGSPMRFDVSDTAAQREYAVLAGAPALHAQALELIR